MKLIDRARNYFSRFEPSLTSGLFSWIEAAECFVATPLVMQVANDSLGKLPWGVPFDYTWIEWDNRENDVLAQHGAMVSKANAATFDSLKLGADYPFDAMRSCFVVNPFYWDAHYQDRVVSLGYQVFLTTRDGEPESACFPWLSRTPAWTTDLALYDGQDDPEPEWKAYLRAFLPQLIGVLAAFSCRNIDSTIYEPTPREIKNQKRSGRLAPVAFHTLRVELPRSLNSPSGSGIYDHDPKRLHTVRGHFKMLRDPKFKNPGWHWWPAHLRGSSEKGIVIKDYKLETKE